jgi:hypothetical protein
LEEGERSGVETATSRLLKAVTNHRTPKARGGASSAKNPRHRRVIHLEYAANPLPAGLRWFEQGATG